MGLADDWDDYLDEPWAAEERPSGSVTGLRMVLSDAHSGASDAQIEDALTEVMDAMSPAEAFDFGAALNQIARGASHALSDPTVAPIARTVLPLAAGAVGTFIGGPVGTALGSQLGTIAANALPPVRGSRATAPVVARAVPTPGGIVPGPGPARAAATLPAIQAGGPEPGAPTSPAAGGSVAAAQGLVLSANPLIRQALAAAAFGQHGQQQVAGIPVAQLLGLLSQVVGRAAEDADELRYVSTAPAAIAPEAGEPGEGDAYGSGGGELSQAGQNLYMTLVDAENLDLAEAFDLSGWEP